MFNKRGDEYTGYLYEIRDTGSNKERIYDFRILIADSLSL